MTLYVDRKPAVVDRAHHNEHRNEHHHAPTTADRTPHPLAHLTSLVLVACHSVYTGLDFQNPEDASAWALLDYQKSTEGQTHSFLEHIMLGVEEAAKDDSALLVFSGGQTRKTAGPRAESQGYWLVAESMGWFGTGRVVRDRSFTEEHSRDSLENLVFSLCRFYELTGRYPEQLTIVSYDFKEERFLDAHAAALGWWVLAPRPTYFDRRAAARPDSALTRATRCALRPFARPEERMRFVGTPALNVGIDLARRARPSLPFALSLSLMLRASLVRQEEMVKGEEKTRLLFEQDPYGCGDELLEKRLSRDPFANGAIDADRCPALAPAFDACMRDEVSTLLGPGSLPWWN